MKVAVTGAAGFVGTNLVRSLVAAGHQVVAVDRVRPAADTGEAGDEQVTWVDGDVLDRRSMEQALDGAEVVYHLVAMITLAQNSDRAWTVNTKGVRTVAEAALAVGARRMVHCSSIHSFDQIRCGGVLDESSVRSTDRALPVYDRSKWEGEVQLRQVVDQGLDAVICNPTGVYGPTDHGLSRINGLLRTAARGRTPVLIEGGFDLVDVRDVADGLMAAAEKGRTGENYLLSGSMLRMLDAFRTAARAAGRRGPAFAVPLSVVDKILPVVEPIGARFGSDVLSRAAMAALLAAPVVDGTKARSELGFSPRPADETIRDLIAFLVTSGQFSVARAG
ncbi:NAD-dependent epimerase/dehydratase family protein [Rhodococcus triatomae]|uniref:Dihydroflavonol-4-reductase n=1 Tax=Rhodococcus triatomae TaxID=300028 RepID=A0A1G8B8R5_9NOCA|nr:NAD-dependent epimerase/dehydratase family protein [Rhodococcus triatomae]QNG17537.1 NAD-dependent epimerase/dehydratase family protein [Rhodococcus triatomae]QNG22795.1 NAD-dependent epimerase/dehydratase family protein [Rhodococcus triatomae]SDH29568.1 dihydroflavonol-4-reductase [Rhodococcus triatomae]